MGRGLLSHSLYIPQIYNLKFYIADDHLLILKSEDMFVDGLQVMNMIIKFLGLNDFDYSDIVKRKFNVGYAFQDKGNQKAAGFRNEKAKMSTHHISNHTQRLCEQLFEPYNRQLGQFMSNPKWNRNNKSPWEYTNIDLSIDYTQE